MVVRLQPHIVTAVDITNEFGETLVCKRLFQPYIHTFSFPLGKMHYDEPVAAAAQRELYEKTGLQDVVLTQRGMVYVTAAKENVVISKILCHVFQGSVPGRPQTAPQKPGRGKNSWVNHTSLASSDCMPGFMAIKNLLASSQQELFFAELSETI
jgi:ADP-ribose pyrophosphatase YjhB (NUDIX family)